MSKELPDKDDILKILKSVKDPETQLSVYELGLVKSIDYIEQTKTLLVKVDFLRRNPSCVGCLPIAWMVQKKITDELYKRFIVYEGVESVEFKDV